MVDLIYGDILSFVLFEIGANIFFDLALFNWFLFGESKFKR